VITRLTQLEEAKAHFLWSKKKMDTLQITEALGLGRSDEVLIWRSLYERRDRDRGIAAALATMKKYGLGVRKAAP
jgi:hypothetical protein